MGNQCCGNEHKEYQSGDEKSHKSKGASTSTSSKAASSNNEQARVNVQTRQPMPIKHSDWQNEVNENPRQESYQRPQSRDQHAPMKTEKPKQEQTKGLEKYKKKSKKAPKQPLTEGGNGIIHESWYLLALICYPVHMNQFHADMVRPPADLTERDDTIQSIGQFGEGRRVVIRVLLTTAKKIVNRMSNTDFNKTDADNAKSIQCLLVSFPTSKLQH
ncbi:hypothetical protein MAR_024026 [Mya arenaria]|uniref:Uncharacterized protein n=1 Tax=Mya arenaria TaxID=6604 RepID=A0ABY7DRX5_MYAAR|nr:hypothetical protein MAR_024026 [Mya arenaria]